MRIGSTVRGAARPLHFALLVLESVCGFLPPLLLRQDAAQGLSGRRGEVLRPVQAPGCSPAIGRLYASRTGPSAAASDLLLSGRAGRPPARAARRTQAAARLCGVDRPGQ